MGYRILVSVCEIQFVLVSSVVSLQKPLRCGPCLCVFLCVEVSECQKFDGRITKNFKLLDCVPDFSWCPTPIIAKRRLPSGVSDCLPGAEECLKGVVYDMLVK